MLVLPEFHRRDAEAFVARYCEACAAHLRRFWAVEAAWYPLSFGGEPRWLRLTREPGLPPVLLSVTTRPFSLRVGESFRATLVKERPRG